jgi:hypothetical protein
LRWPQIVENDIHQAFPGSFSSTNTHHAQSVDARWKPDSTISPQLLDDLNMEGFVAQYNSNNNRLSDAAVLKKHKQNIMKGHGVGVTTFLKAKACHQNGLSPIQ